MQASNHRAKQHPDTAPPWVVFVEVTRTGNAAGVRGVQGTEDVAALPDWQSMDGQQLENMLAPYLDQLEIVISDWRALHAPLEDFRRQLPAPLAKRVVDTMFLPELTNSSWSDYHSMAVTRYACFRLWLERRRPRAGDRWVAIEQDGLLETWPATEREHVIVGTVAQPQVVHQLIERLTANSDAPPSGR